MALTWTALLPGFRQPRFFALAAMLHPFYDGAENILGCVDNQVIQISAETNWAKARKFRAVLSYRVATRR